MQGGYAMVHVFELKLDADQFADKAKADVTNHGNRHFEVYIEDLDLRTCYHYASGHIEFRPSPVWKT
jgi:hypothetical protein